MNQEAGIPPLRVQVPAMSNDPRRPRRPRPQRQQVSDIERFLQEVDRLRRKASDEAQPAEGRRAQEEVLEVQEVLPVEPPPRRSFADELVDDVVVVAEPAGRANEYSPPPVRYRPPVSPPPPVQPVLTPTAAKPGSVAQTTKSIVSPQIKQKTASPAARIVSDLLRSKQNIQAAIFLREILGEPVCRRRRR